MNKAESSQNKWTLNIQKIKHTYPKSEYKQKMILFLNTGSSKQKKIVTNCKNQSIKKNLLETKKNYAFSLSIHYRFFGILCLKIFKSFLITDSIFNS